MNKRDSTYNTTVPDDTCIVIYILIDDSDGTELCLKGSLYKYKYRER